MLREVKLLRLLRGGPSMIELRALIAPANEFKSTDFNRLYMVFDFFATDLSKVLHSSLVLDVHQVKKLMVELLRGVQHLHKHR